VSHAGRHRPRLLLATLVGGLAVLSVVLTWVRPASVASDSLPLRPVAIARREPAPTTMAPRPPPPTTTEAPTTTSTSTTTTVVPVPSAVAAMPVAGPGLAVGDSVMEDVQLYAPATLSVHGVTFNAAVGRQWETGVAIVSQLRSEGRLPPVVIVGLGTNGAITPAQFDDMMQAAAGARRVVFMTVTGPCTANNPIIRAGVARYPQAALADWATLAAQHPEWFARDGVHIGPAGAQALGTLLADAA
jgi:hypothetical protein